MIRTKTNRSLLEISFNLNFINSTIPCQIHYFNKVIPQIFARIEKNTQQIWEICTLKMFNMYRGQEPISINIVYFFRLNHMKLPILPPPPLFLPTEMAISYFLNPIQPCRSLLLLDLAKDINFGTIRHINAINTGKCTSEKRVGKHRYLKCQQRKK